MDPNQDPIINLSGTPLTLLALEMIITKLNQAGEVRIVGGSKADSIFNLAAAFAALAAQAQQSIGKV